MKTQKEPQMEYLVDVSTPGMDWEVWGYMDGYLGVPEEVRNGATIVLIDDFVGKFPKESKGIFDRMKDAARNAEFDAREAARDKEVDLRIDEALGK